MNLPAGRQILLCDADPDSRRQIETQLCDFGYAVLATGNPQIASGLIQERQFRALLVAMSRMMLSLVPVIVDARRSQPALPIVVILNEPSPSSMPPGLADLILVSPTSMKLRLSLKALIDEPVCVAC